MRVPPAGINKNQFPDLTSELHRLLKAIAGAIPDVF